MNNVDSVTKNTEIKKEDTPKVDIKSFDWEGGIPESRLVVLTNFYGSIRSRNHLEEKVYVHATIQEIGESPVKPTFKIEEKEGKLYIAVEYTESLFDKKGLPRGRTDVSILFPDTVHIYAETNDGLIKIDKTASHVTAKSKSGTINLSTHGLFHATTESGTITLKMRGIKEPGLSYAKSTTGLIKAEIFSDMDILLNGKSEKGIYFNDKKQNKNELLFKQGEELSQVNFLSEKGEIHLSVVNPPELVQSVKPTTKDVDLRKLPKVKPWKPGDIVFDRDDKVDQSKKKVQQK